MGHIQGRIGLFTTSWHTPRLTGVRAANGFSVRAHSQVCPEHGCLQGHTRERSRHCFASRRFARRADFANVVDLAPGAGIGCEPAPGTRLRPGCRSCRKNDWIVLSTRAVVGGRITDARCLHGLHSSMVKNSIRGEKKPVGESTCDTRSHARGGT